MASPRPPAEMPPPDLGHLGGQPLRPDSATADVLGLSGGEIDAVVSTRLRSSRPGEPQGDDPSDIRAYGATAHYPEREATVRAFRGKLLDWLLGQVGRADVEMSNEGSMVARFEVESAGGRPIREGIQVVVRHDPDR